MEKKEILRVFAPHIFFDDQLGHTKPASSEVPAGHVPFGIKNPLLLPAPQGIIITPPPADVSADPVEAPEPLILEVQIKKVQALPLSEEAFEQQCRLIFRHYTPMSSGKKNVVLPPRYRDFIAKNKKSKTPEQRGKIAADLSRYDLSDLVSHEPMLNRERDDVVARKLAKIAGDPEVQQDFDLNLK